MPLLDGFAVVRAIRENTLVAALPVLAVTAYAMQGDRERILSSGFDGYLPKPINAKSLAEELERLLSERDTRNNVPKQSRAESNRKRQAATAAGSDG